MRISPWSSGSSSLAQMQDGERRSGCWCSLWALFFASCCSTMTRFGGDGLQVLWCGTQPHWWRFTTLDKGDSGRQAVEAASRIGGLARGIAASTTGCRRVVRGATRGEEYVAAVCRGRGRSDVLGREFAMGDWEADCGGNSVGSGRRGGLQGRGLPARRKGRREDGGGTAAA
jgi:hypothetical protein